MLAQQPFSQSHQTALTSTRCVQQNHNEDSIGASQHVLICRPPCPLCPVCTPPMPCLHAIMPTPPYRHAHHAVHMPRASCVAHTIPHQPAAAASGTCHAAGANAQHSTHAHSLPEMAPNSCHPVHNNTVTGIKLCSAQTAGQIIHSNRNILQRLMARLIRRTCLLCPPQ